MSIKYCYNPNKNPNVYITGYVEPKGKRFNVSFMNEKTGQYIFHMSNRCSENKIVFNTTDLKMKKWEKEDIISSNVFQSGKKFQLCITCTKEHFYISVDNTWHYHFPCRYDYLLADTISIVGDVTLCKLSKNKEQLNT